MSGPVIIRLQNLPLEARSIDIRRFFEGLLIPDGGVHIIGGERGDAFIAFQSDEDARQAMSRDNYLLCSSKIKLFLSSKTEMQNVIASARNQQPTTAKPVKDSIQSSNLSQILNIATNSSTAQTGTNSMDLLSSLNKLISSSSNINSSVTPMSLMSSNLTQQSSITTKYNNYEDNNNTKTSSLLNGLFPNKSNEMSNDPLSSLLAKVNNPINSNSIKPVVTNNDKSNISIDQILNLLQNHATQQQATSSSALPSILDNKNEQKTFNYSQSNYSNNEQDESRFNNRNGSSPYNNNNNRFNNNNFNNNNNQKFQPNNQNKRRFDENNDSTWRDSNNTDNKAAVLNKPYQRTILDPIIKVRNFNSNCSYKDIRTFLQGIQIEHDGIKLLTDPNGHRNGTAYVKLMTITDLKKALCRNGQFYEENSITVAQATENEFTNAQFVFTFRNNNNNNNNNNNSSNNLDKTNQFQNNQRFNNNNMNKRPDQQPQLQQQQQQQPIVNKPTETEQIQQPIPVDTNIGFYFKIYGLPAKFDEQALRSMFNNVKFVRIVTSTPTPITSTNTTNGTTEQITTIKAKKLCQVETQLDLERALTRQDERVGKSKLQIFQISRSEYDRELANLTKNNNHYNNYQSDQLDQNQNSLDNNDQEDDQELSDDLFIYMHGVPFSAKEQDVRFFFQGLNIQTVIVMIDQQTQKPTGECCCQFMSKQDRDRSLEKDDQLFRNRVVKVKPINQAEFNQYKFKFMSRNNKIKSIMSLSPTERGIPSLFQSNSPQDNSNDNENDEQADEFESNNRYFDSNSNDGSEQKFNKFNNRGNFTNQQRNFNDNGLKRRAINSYSTDSQSDNNNKRVKSSSFFNQRNNYSNNYNENDQNDNETDQAPILPPLPPELQKYRNRLVLFSNISYDASREDILELVKQYIPLEQTLKIRHDDMGQPTGDAVVALSTSDFAVNACLNLNGSEFMGRNIKATLFSS